MRTISFRGKRVDNGNWIYGTYYQDGNGLSFIIRIGGKLYPVDHSTVGQYTGIESDKAKKIYEGDTVQLVGGEYANGASGVDAVGVVVFERGSFLLKDKTGVYHSFDLVPRDKIKFISSPA